MDVRAKSLAPTCAMGGASLSFRPDKHMDVRAKSLAPTICRPLGWTPTLTCRSPAPAGEGVLRRQLPHRKLLILNPEQDRLRQFAIDIHLGVIDGAGESMLVRNLQFANVELAAPETFAG